MAYLFLLSRILFGGFFIYNGYSHLKGLAGMTGYAMSKKVPAPKIAVIGSGALMILGGLGIILGVAPMLSIVAILVCLIPITFIMHAYWRETDPHTKMMEKIAFTKNIAIIAGALAFLFISTPWILSL